MIIGKKYLCKNTVEDLIKIAKQKKWTSDEPILNVFFDNTKTTFLPKKYNTLTTEITNDNLKDSLIIQYVGVKKPWLGKTLEDRHDTFNLQRLNSRTLAIKVDMLYQLYYKKAIAAYGIG
jgi:lipopolysaccharide biosynthesis glycosyltransferase